MLCAAVWPCTPATPPARTRTTSPPRKAETPNPASLVVLGNSYVLDPTHVRPLHPSLMVFLCEGAGFRDDKKRASPEGPAQ